jgi:hypothetical protein
MPPGICAVDSSASKPGQRAAVDGYADHRPNGVSGNGARQVGGHAGAADEDGTSRALPHPPRTPPFACGVRWAEVMRTSWSISSLLRVSAAACMTGQSDSEPMSMATKAIVALLCVG